MNTFFEKLDSYLVNYIVEETGSFNLGLAVYDLLEDEESKRELENVEYLLGEGCREEALYLAAKYGFADVVLQNIDKLFIEALMMRAEFLNINIVEYGTLERLRSGGIRPDSFEGITGVWCARLKLDKSLMRIMNISARYNRLNIMIELANNNILINRDTLAEAMKGGSLRAIKYILERGFEETSPFTCPGETNLEHLKYVMSRIEVDLVSTARDAIIHDNLENLIYLNENYEFDDELLYCSLRYELRIFKYLLDEREDVDYSDLITDAISAGNVQITYYLLDNFGVEDDAREYIMYNNLYTPETVSMIIDKEWWEFDLQDLFTECVKRGRVSILKVLMDGRLSFEKRTVEEWLRISIEEGEINVVEYLLDKGYGNLETLIYQAAELDNLEMVEYLVGRMSYAKSLILSELDHSIPSKRVSRYLKSLAH